MHFSSGAELLINRPMTSPLVLTVKPVALLVSSKPQSGKDGEQ